MAMPYENDSTQSKEELLKQIKSSCMQDVAGNKSSIELAMPAFSALLVNLSNEASNTADKNLKTQKYMLYTTLIILLFTFMQLVNTFYQSPQKLPSQTSSNIKIELPVDGQQQLILKQKEDNSYKVTFQPPVIISVQSPINDQQQLKRQEAKK